MITLTQDREGNNESNQVLSCHPMAIHEANGFGQVVKKEMIRKRCTQVLQGLSPSGSRRVKGRILLACLGARDLLGFRVKECGFESARSSKTNRRWQNTQIRTRYGALAAQAVKGLIKHPPTHNVEPQLTGLRQNTEGFARLPLIGYLRIAALSPRWSIPKLLTVAQKKCKLIDYRDDRVERNWSRSRHFHCRSSRNQHGPRGF